MSIGHRKVHPNELYVEIVRELTTYTKEVRENINEAANRVTKELLSDIREDSPVRTGGPKSYKRGWQRKKLKYHYVVYNKNKPYITHILENGGKHSRAFPHIKKNAERAVLNYEDMCVAIVSEGVRLIK